MSIYPLPGDMCELLDRPVDSELEWDWAVWGEIASVRDRLPAAGREVVLLAADDTESRLLSSLPALAWLPFAALPWIAGGAIPRAALTPQSSTWSQLLLGANGVDWIWSQRRPDGVKRPALTPAPAQSASHALKTFIQAVLPSRRTPEVMALEAGWLQLADDLDASHRCSQAIEGAGRHQSGDYWHAIMHRREPDYGNSKYWFHQFRGHPSYSPLASEVSRVSALFSSSKFDAWTPRLLAGGGWNPTAFVACCEAAASREDMAFRAAVEELQYRELLLLLNQSQHDAAG